MAVTDSALPSARPALPAESALADLYRTEFTVFVRVASGIAGNGEDGFEAVQDAFARLLAARSRPEGDGLRPYVWRAVVNAAKDRRRRGVTRGRAEARLAREHREVPGEDTVDSRTRAVVAGLPERQRLVLFLRYYADLDYRGIARAAGIRVGTVGPTLQAAERAVRDAIEREDGL